MTDARPEPRTNGLDERLVERCEAIPERPPAGDYVVVDVMFFSTTVVELLANGADRVHVTDARGEEFDYREQHPATLLGGEAIAGHEPAAGYDFFNSPSDVQDLPLTGRPVSMTSTNGGRAVATLRDRVRDRDDVSVFVGSTINAAAVGEFLRERSRSTYLVSAGTCGSVAVEDHIGATLISRYLDGLSPAATELDVYRRHLEVAKGEDYVERAACRRRDVEEYATDIDGREVVPHLRGDSLVDALDPAPVGHGVEPERMVGSESTI